MRENAKEESREEAEATAERLEAAEKLDDAVNAFLDEVQRTTGQRDFKVPDTDAARRAILGLYDAVGRNP